MLFTRSAGVLLHPTSLPGSGGIGTLGPQAFRFVDILEASALSLWQVLPLAPTGYADSPYAALSAFAGNPLLIALEPLVTEGLLSTAEVAELPDGPKSRVDFGVVIPAKMALLRRAYERFQERGDASRLEAFRREHESWLADFALYMAIKGEHGGASWHEWEWPLRVREPEALEAARTHLTAEIDFQRWVQFVFFQQWMALKTYANQRGVRIVGDIPIFVADDSAEVWANPSLFQLDASGTPTVVAGVPPDVFTETGQLWGNPIYNWDEMEKSGFAWWIERFRRLLHLVDMIRLDHFRGFAATWNIPYGNPTAEHGEWIPVPGAALFQSLQSALGELPIIAEDLGVITPDVTALREAFGFPGMKILQFAFDGGPHNPSLPHNFPRDCVVYTGTHDNDTTIGWYQTLSPEERAWIARYLGKDNLDISWDLMRLAFASVADIAIVPLQDVLRLGTSARMNLPGSVQGNWSWRYAEGEFTDEHIAGLRNLSETFGRSRRDPGD